MSGDNGHINIYNFDAHWDKLSNEDQAAFIRSCAKLDPGLAISPVLEGLSSAHFSVRNQARKTLKTILLQIDSLLQDSFDQNHLSEGMKASARVCAQIFLKFVPGLSFDEKSYYFKLLLTVKGWGAYFAFKAIYKKKLDMDFVRKVALTAPEPHRLDLIREYLRTDPNVRLKFGKDFKQLVRSITKKDAVVRFYADLFELKQDNDPFLHHLKPGLRQPEQMLSACLGSNSPATRIQGLKAAAMISEKLPAKQLADLLESEKDLMVRKTIYRIIENASLGSYPKLFKPLLNRLDYGNGQEGFHAFKALIVCGKKPLFEVVELVKKKHPKLTGHLYEKISQLSKISFFFIQDIAENQCRYMESHIELNLAAVFGIAKKRPERVIHLLQQYTDPSDKKTFSEVKKFTQKVTLVLDKEKKSILKQFDPITAKVKNKIQAPDGFLKSFFSFETHEKKIAALKNNTLSGPMNFESITLAHIDLSDVSCQRYPLYFNTGVIRNSNFSNAQLFNASFKRCIFYKVNLRHCHFDSVNFSDAVFINVTAENAIFKNCNLQNVSVFNCNFNRSCLQEAFLIGATISKSTFDKADLSGACFAGSFLSAVSFIGSNLMQADFSGMKARFCRFPVHAKTAVSKSGADLNARQYQIEAEDLPGLDQHLLSRINLLLFSEFFHYGEKKFFRQNKQSLITAFDIFRPRQSDLFRMIPYLIHENLNLPGFNTRLHPETPCGIHEYDPDPETLETFARYNNGKMPEQGTINACIQGLSTIGSIGSVAQTNDSDIDYWVCIIQEQLGKTGLTLLKKKLSILEQYAQSRFHIQITFFLVDISRAQKNDFGDSSVESSGSAQAMLLKEEFYRTMIHVAGKLPLWAVLPTAVSKACYADLSRQVSRLPHLARYIDLGDIQTIGPGEFFGATIWQMFKSLKSPFKSVIKMALLEKYIRESGEKPLLCNLVKDEWMNSGVNLKLAQNDAYYILLKELHSFYTAAKDKEAVSLLVTCFYLKLGICSEDDIEKTVFGMRKILLEKCLDHWNWSKEKLFKVGSYKEWPFKNITGLSKIIASFTIKKYKDVNNIFESLGHDRALISAEDRTVLGRKVWAELSRQPGKISKDLLISKNDALFSSLKIDYHASPGQKAGEWELISSRSKGQIQTESVLTAKTIEEFGAWLILNRIYSPKTHIRLVPNPTPVTAEDLLKLFNEMDRYFTPFIKHPVDFEKLLNKKTVLCLFVSVNFYAPAPQRHISDYTAVYLNTWGEMFTTRLSMGHSFSDLNEMSEHLCSRLGISSIPSCSVCLHKGRLKTVCM